MLNNNTNLKIAFISQEKSFDTLYGLIIYSPNGYDIEVVFELKNIELNKIIKAFELIGEKNINIIKKSFIDENINIVSDNFLKVLSTFHYLKELLSFYWMMDWFLTNIYYRLLERDAEYNKETKNDSILFQNQDENENPFKVYSDLIQKIKMIINNNRNSLLITGPPGISKSYILRRTFYFAKFKHGKDFTLIKGGGIEYNEIYKLFFNNRNKIIIFDDFDTPLTNIEILNLLKSATDTYPNRILSYFPPPHNKSNDNYNDVTLPKKFEFKGKLIIITNIEKEKIDSALINRMLTVELKYSNEELLKMISSFLKYVSPTTSLKIKNEVLSYIQEVYIKNKNIIINFRTFDAAIDVRLAFPENWKTHVDIIVGYKN